MKFSSQVSAAAILAKAASAGTVVWDGRFTDTSASDLSKWSWSNQVGAYQYYIHGTGDVAEYVNIGAEYANPADGSGLGVKISLTDTAYWNGQTMRRTELIPQTKDTAAISSGTLYYHFSIKRSDTNAPSVNREHQIAFFESHFTELKAGWLSGASGDSDASLRWFANSQSQWNVTWEADVWHNIAYEINFDANTVGFWHSTGSDALTQVVAPVSASVSSNGADWHLGALELPRDGYTDSDEDFFFSGVYIESGDLTTTFSGSSGSGNSGAAPSSTVAATSTVAASSVASNPTTLVTSTKATASAAASTSSAVESAVTTAVASPTSIATQVTSSAAASAVTTETLPVTTSALPSAASSSSTAPASSSSAKPCKSKKRKARQARRLP
ncbi:hypothetical protein JX265_000667 [Neoarthrinium moseri]|uniref:Glycoside hydrolase 131 catalytic N-terminal domain-containing protein n=1 Tax=Neoarthrinium moseri TaxID=1658444 RepID=A0A9P9WZ61_9PEZI|nr:hypothetical protein JX265_000667 [Neoarthrinium moseri]